MRRDPYNKCAWCGKSGANSMFGGDRIHFCNYRCAMAKNFYEWSAIFMFFVFCTMLLFVFPMFEVFSEHYTFLTPILGNLFAIMMYAFFIVLDTMLVYMLAVGFKLRQERIAS